MSHGSGATSSFITSGIHPRWARSGFDAESGAERDSVSVKHVLKEEIGMVAVIRAHKSRRRPDVLTREEVVKLPGRLEGSWWLMGILLYGSGLRQIECLR